MADLSFSLTFGGTPFFSDAPRAFRLNVNPGTPDNTQQIPRKHQPETDFLDEINRLFPFDYVQEWGAAESYPGRDNGALARTIQDGRQSVEVRIGDYYYPNGARKWSVFRGLATSSAVKAMEAATQGCRVTAAFVMSAEPVQPGKTGRTYGIDTQLFLLPPRCIGECNVSEGVDGLYLVTLVDERYDWQHAPVTLRPGDETTWDGLLQSCATALGITLTYSTISSAYGQPEPDSQLWAAQSDAATLLNALALNLGRTVARAYDGTYKLYTPDESLTLARSSRKSSDGRVVRLAGGDAFCSGGALPVGDRQLSRQGVLPNVVRVTFPKYVQGDDPVPHFLDTRDKASRWYEDGYAERYAVDVPLLSGGSLLSGLQGTGIQLIHSTAKALYGGESGANYGSGVPLNLSGIQYLANQVASDYLVAQAGTGIDEAYLGTLAWTPDGLHDLLFSYSPRKRLATTRAVRSEWTAATRETQYGTPAVSGGSVSQRGSAGKAVALTVRDALTGGQSAMLSGPLFSGDPSACFSGDGANLPQTARWKALIENERVLFEGLSGTTKADVVRRAIDGTLQANHAAGIYVSGLLPNIVYMTDLITFKGPAVTVEQGAYTSGGIREAIITVTGGSGNTALTSGDVYNSGVTINWYSTNNYNTYFSWLWYDYPSASGVISGYALQPAPKLRITAYSGTVITGFGGGQSGRVLILWNAGDGNSPSQGPFTIGHEDSRSLASERVICPLSGAYTVWPKDGCMLEFDGVSKRWRFDHPTIGAGNTVGGGGTSGLRTYALRNLKAGSGLTYTPDTTEDGAGILTLSSGVGGSSGGGGGGGGGMDYNYPQQAGCASNGGRFPDGRYYWGGRLITPAGFAQTGSASLPISGRQMVTPFYCPRGGSIDILGFNIVVSGHGSGDSARIALYDNVAPGDPYPHNLLMDTGVQYLLSGPPFQRYNVSALDGLLSPGLYWLAIALDTRGTGMNPTPTIHGLHLTDLYPILGTEYLGGGSGLVGGAGVGYYLDTNQGGSPSFTSPYPNGAGVMNNVTPFDGAIPMVLVRFRS